MTDGARQLVLDLPVETRFEAEDFLVGPANALAFGTVERWPDWPARLLHLEGPAGSGKSHLGAIWAARTGAVTLDAASLPDVPGAVEAGAVLVEDIDRPDRDEPSLFHLVNLARERSAYVLFTSAVPVDRCGIRTPDLLSRLRLAPTVRLGEPDDALLKAVLVKLFVDRQLVVDTGVVDFLALRIERSLAAAAATVAALDREALSRGRRVTRVLAQGVLAGHDASPSYDCHEGSG